MAHNGRGSAYERALEEASRDTGDTDAVLRNLNRGIAEGDPRAAYALGAWFLTGKEPWVFKDYSKAAKLLKLAAAAKLPEALHDLAACYERGWGVRKNESHAFRCFVSAAIHGHRESHYDVGRCYYHGIGAETDRKLANVWLDRAEELGINPETGLEFNSGR